MCAPGIRSLSFPNNSHIIASDRIDLLFKVNVEFLHYGHVVSIRGITNNLLIFSVNKIMAEKFYRDDRVRKTRGQDSGWKRRGGYYDSKVNGRL